MSRYNPKEFLRGDDPLPRLNLIRRVMGLM
jgi:hypothetical protein